MVRDEGVESRSPRPGSGPALTQVRVELNASGGRGRLAYIKKKKRLETALMSPLWQPSSV